MAYSPEDLLSTPSGYASPEQLASVQQYAALLSKGGMRDKEITSPWQGVRMMADALSGGMMRNQAGQMGQQNRNLDASGIMGAAQPPGGMASLSDQQTPGPQASLGPQGVGGLDPQTARTFKLESGGDPNARTGSNVGLGQFGPEEMRKYGITNPSDPNQQISAMHKETAENAQGLAKALGRQPTPGEIYLAHQQGLAGATALLTNPNAPAWQAVRKFYPSDAVAQKAIAGNPPGGGHFDPNAPAGAFSQAWVKQFESRMPKGAAGQTADLSGGIGGVGASPPGSPQAMSGALAANTGAGSAEPPMAKSGNPTFGAQYAPMRPQINPQKLQQLLSSPTLDPAMKQQLYQQYMQQNQPVEAAGPGGRWVIPSGGGKPLWIPEIQKYKEGEFEVPATSDPQGNLTVRPLGGGAPQGGPPPSAPSPVWGKFGQPGAAPPAPAAAPPGPQSEAQPPPGGAPGIASAAPQGGAQPPPSMLSSAPPGAQPPVRVASLDPTSGVNPSAQQTPPPAGGPLPAASTPPASPAGSQVAQAQGQLGPLGDFVDRLKQWDIGNKVQQESQTEQAKSFAQDAEKERVGLNEAATKSATGLSQLQTAKALLDDPNLSAGFLAKARGELQKARALIGNNPNAARANEVFDKVIASQTLPELSAQTKQMGQVRLAELQVVQSSLASRNLTPEGAKAVLDIMMNAHRLNMDVSELANSFAQGWRLGPDGKPYQSGQKGLNSYEWQPTLQKFLAANPVISPEMRANWEKNFGSNLEEAATRGGTESKGSTGRPQPMATPAPGYSQDPPLPPGNWRKDRP